MVIGQSCVKCTHGFNEKASSRSELCSTEPETTVDSVYFRPEGRDILRLATSLRCSYTTALAFIRKFQSGIVSIRRNSTVRRGGVSLPRFIP